MMRSILISMLLLLPGSAFAVEANQQPKTSDAERVELDYIVAIVNDDVLLRSELDTFLRTVRQQLASQKTPLPPENVLLKQGLDRLVLNRIQLQLANSTGIRVDDETLNQAVARIAQQNNLSLDQFRRALESQNFNFEHFREDIRNEIIMTRLQQQQVTNRIRISEQEVDSFLANQKELTDENQSFHLGHILVALPDAASPEKIKNAYAKAQSIHQKLVSGEDFSQAAVALSDGQKALEGGDLGWFTLGQMPTVFVNSVKKMQPGQISDVIRSPSGFHIVKLLETKGEAKHLIKQTSARHILLKPSAVASDREVRNRLLQLKQRIEDGDSFADLAKAHSADTLSAREGGDLGWLSPGETVPQFEQVMDRLDKNKVSEPFKTRFGWHIVQVLDRRDHDDTDKVQRSKALEQIRARKIQEAIQLWIRRIRDEAFVELRLPS